MGNRLSRQQKLKEIGVVCQRETNLIIKKNYINILRTNLAPCSRVKTSLQNLKNKTTQSNYWGYCGAGKIKIALKI